MLALDKFGHEIKVGNRVHVSGNLNWLWGPYARVIDIGGAFFNRVSTVVIRPEYMFKHMRSSAIGPADRIISSREVEVTISDLIVRKFRLTK